jgi:L-threonylcarbamoyladenylate synthase
MKTIKAQIKNIGKIAKEVERGGVVICPTDTVYGFLADASNKKAVNKIFKIKKRPKTKPLAVFVKDLKTAKALAEIDGNQEKIIQKKWPGKYTFILRRKKGIKIYDKAKSTIAIRIPKHNFLSKLLNKIDKPLAQTSVNISNGPPLAEISDIIEQFNKIDVLLIDGGNLKKAKPSKIIDLSGDKIKVLR